jgi:hypothetical protein
MDYLDVCDSYSKKVVFVFGKTNGGIGDLTKFFTYLLQLCIQHRIRLYYLLTGDPIDNYIKLDSKFYISKLEHELYLQSIHQLPDILDNVMYVVRPQLMYNVDNLYDKLTLHLHDIFSFTQEVIERAAPYMGDYVSVHLRLGDKFLETDKRYVMVPTDERTFDESNLFRFLASRNVFFFCDNKSYKQRVKRMFDHTQITDFDIGHSSFINTTHSQLIDGLAEFYLISKSKHIYKASYSGFSIMASKMYQCPISDL